MIKAYSSFRTALKGLTFILSAFGVLQATDVQAQLLVPFTKRTTPQNIKVRGDFAMIGNTNLRLTNYTDDQNNSVNMSYVDVDGVDTTFNSSSATLVLSTENGAVPSCSNIVFAGLYWTGRSSNASSSPNTFTVTKSKPNGSTTSINNTTVYTNEQLINSTNYTLVLQRNAVSTFYPIYNFYDHLNNVYSFSLTNSGAADRLTVSINGAAATNIPVTYTVNGTTNVGTAVLTTPFVIVDGTANLTISQFVRDSRTDLTLAQIQTASNATVSVVDINGCGNTASITLNLSCTPGVTIDLTSGTNPLCAGSTATIMAVAPEALTYLWNTGETAESIVVSTAGDYIVEIVGFNGCSSTDTINVTVNDLPAVAVDITNGTNPICQGDSLELTAVAATAQSYQWTTGSTDQSIWVSSTGTFRVNVVDVNGCENFAELAVTITPNPTVDVNITTGTMPFCAGDSVEVTASATGATAWSWSNGATTASIWATQSGTYDVVVSDANGCAGNGSINVDVTQPPVVTIDITNGTNPTCEGNSVELTANSATGTSWIWTNGEMAQSTIISASGTYCVSVQDANGCASVSCIDVVVSPNPTIDIAITAGSLPICAGDSIQLTANTTNAASVIWNPSGLMETSIWVSTSGTYTATATNAGGCADVASIDVVVNPVPTVVVDITSGADVFCTGDSVQLTANATGATSYLWSNGATTESIWIVAGDDYCVTVLNDAFCSATACRTITEVTSPTVNVGPDVDICLNAFTTLSVLNPISGATYTWTVDGNTVGTGTSISVSPGVGITEYIVTVDVSCGTVATDAIKVHVFDQVVASFTQTPAGIVILGNSVAFTNTSTGGPNAFSWTFGDGATDVVASPEHMYMAQGIYDVSMVATNGECSDTAFSTVEVQVIIDVPNPFTPNNDGYNDMVWLSGAENQMLDIQVFSRWGHLVWEGHGRTLQWEGRSNSGTELEEGIYYYVLNITPDGDVTKTQTGFITLLM